MSYYEWIQNLENLKNSPMDENIINYLETKKIDYNRYVLNKLTIHFIKTINTRINNSLSKCIREMNTSMDLNTLSIQFVNLKNEKEYVSKLANLSVIDIENKNILKDFIETKYETIYNLLKRRITHIDKNGEYTSTLEKILCNTMEEKV